MSETEVADILEAVRREDRAAALAKALASHQRGNGHPLVLMLAAEAFSERGDDASALPLLRRALEASDEAELWRRYAAALARMGQPEDALAALNEALDIDPDDIAALGSAGVIAFEAGRLPVAAGYYERLLTLRPQDPDVLAASAAVAVRRGDVGEAMRLAKLALEQDPGCLTAAMSLARAEVARGDPAAAVDLATEMLSARALGPGAQVAALDIRADARDALGDCEGAFADYAARNALEEQVWAQQIPGLGESRLQQARRLYGEFDVAAWSRRGNFVAGRSGPAAGHVFLLGFPRSGTTLLEKALAGHPQVVTLEEIDVLGACAGEFLSSPQGLERLRLLADADAELLRQRYWQQVQGSAADPHGRIVVDKLPLHTVALPVIARLFPDARVLFAVRDPRDVVLSCFRRRFQMNAAMYEFLDLPRTAAFYDAVMRLAERYRGALSLQLREVRHEDVVADFDGQLAAVLDFVGLQWTPEVRDFSARARQRARTPSDLQLASGLSRAGLGRWRDYVTQLAPVSEVLSPWISRYGYSE